MLCQNFFDLRKKRRELYVQTRTYKSAGRTSLFCLHGKLQGKSMEGWVLAKSHCIPATCGNAFLKGGLSVSTDFLSAFKSLVFFCPVTYPWNSVQKYEGSCHFCFSVLTSFRRESQLISEEVRLWFTYSIGIDSPRCFFYAAVWALPISLQIHTY